MARPRKKKTTKDRLIEAALCAAPAPVRTIASNPIGFRLILIAGTILMATGILTLDWGEGIPRLQFHREKVSQVEQELVNDIGQQVHGWNVPSTQGNGNPPGYFAQSPYNPYQQPAQQPNPQQYGSGYPSNQTGFGNQPYRGNQAGWGQNQGQANGIYNPNNPSPNPYPQAYGNQPLQNPPLPNAPNPQWPNQPLPNQPLPNQQWPSQQWTNQPSPYAPTGNNNPGGYRR